MVCDFYQILLSARIFKAPVGRMDLLLSNYWIQSKVHFCSKISWHWKKLLFSISKFTWVVITWNPEWFYRCRVTKRSHDFSVQTHAWADWRISTVFSLCNYHTLVPSGGTVFLELDYLCLTMITLFLSLFTYDSGSVWPRPTRVHRWEGYNLLLSLTMKALFQLNIFQ